MSRVAIQVKRAPIPLRVLVKHRTERFQRQFGQDLSGMCASLSSRRTEAPIPTTWYLLKAARIARIASCGCGSLPSAMQRPSIRK